MGKKCVAEKQEKTFRNIIYVVDNVIYIYVVFMYYTHITRGKLQSKYMNSDKTWAQAKENGKKWYKNFSIHRILQTISLYVPTNSK